MHLCSYCNIFLDDIRSLSQYEVSLNMDETSGYFNHPSSYIIDFKGVKTIRRRTAAGVYCKAYEGNGSGCHNVNIQKLKEWLKGKSWWFYVYITSPRFGGCHLIFDSAVSQWWTGISNVQERKD